MILTYIHDTICHFTSPDKYLISSEGFAVTTNYQGCSSNDESSCVLLQLLFEDETFNCPDVDPWRRCAMDIFLSDQMFKISKSHCYEHFQS